MREADFANPVEETERLLWGGDSRKGSEDDGGGEERGEGRERGLEGRGPLVGVDALGQCCFASSGIGRPWRFGIGIHAVVVVEVTCDADVVS